MNNKILKFLVFFVIIMILIFICFIILDELNIINFQRSIQKLEDKAENTDMQEQIDYEEKETDFTLIDQYGKKQSLATYRGKKVVILYWAVWCPPCKEEVPIINKLSEEYKDAVFLTIVSPTLGSNSKYKTYQEEIENYIKENNIEVPVLIDKEKTIFDIYNIERYPTTIFIDQSGNIIEKIGSKEESGKLTENEIIKKLESY